MYCEQALITEPTVIIKKRTTPFRDLPAASEVTFPGVFTWSPVSSATVTTALGVDPGAWNVWRNRRLTPAPLPATWFRRASGSPLVYRVSDILIWLAARRGDHLDTLTAWRLSLARDLEQEVTDPTEVRKLAALYARAIGPKIGSVTFTPAGFNTYLSSF